MPHRPVIGIPLQTLAGLPGERPAAYSIGQRYIEVLSRFDAIPWPIPPLANDPDTIRKIFDRLDGLVLAGGSDIVPGRYGEAARPECGPTDPDRDAVEILLVKMALDHSLPILGICRGAQLLNVACGGSLYQDIAAQVPAAIKHDFTAKQGHHDRTGSPHDVTVKAGSKLAEILGTTFLPVNSIHHQAVKELGSGLVASAYAPDGVVEALEMSSHAFVLAVQWHPEDLIDTQPVMGRLFEAFVAAARIES